MKGGNRSSILYKLGRRDEKVGWQSRAHKGGSTKMLHPWVRDKSQLKRGYVKTNAEYGRKINEGRGPGAVKKKGKFSTKNTTLKLDGVRCVIRGRINEKKPGKGSTSPNVGRREGVKADHFKGKKKAPRLNLAWITIFNNGPIWGLAKKSKTGSRGFHSRASINVFVPGKPATNPRSPTANQERKRLIQPKNP